MPLMWLKAKGCTKDSAYPTSGPHKPTPEAGSTKKLVAQPCLCQVPYLLLSLICLLSLIVCNCFPPTTKCPIWTIHYKVFLHRDWWKSNLNVRPHQLLEQMYKICAFKIIRKLIKVTESVVTRTDSRGTGTVTLYHMHHQLDILRLL